MRSNPAVIPVILSAAALYYFGAKLEKRAGTRKAKAWLLFLSTLLALPSFFCAFYYVHLFDNAAWFYRFRALPYSELSISASGLLAGVLNSWLAPETFGERVAIPGALLVLLTIPFVKPILDSINLDRLRDSCDGDVCMQSTFSTCGPSSTATILKLLGKPSSEKELARECFTSRGGTEIWYIARAFERRGFRANVEIQLPDHLHPPIPSIAGVLLPGGAGHFIAIMGETADEITIGDPMKGKLVVKKANLQSYYHLTGFLLAVRPK